MEIFNKDLIYFETPVWLTKQEAEGRIFLKRIANVFLPNVQILLFSIFFIGNVRANDNIDPAIGSDTKMQKPHTFTFKSLKDYDDTIKKV